MKDECVNCGKAKSEHSVYDVFCLWINKWKAEDFEKESQESRDTQEATSGKR